MKFLFKNPVNHPSFIDGRCSKKYYCECGNEITVRTALYGKGKCVKCYHKRKHSLNCVCASCKSMRGEMNGKNNGNYINGKSREPYPLLFNKQLKERIRVRDNFICQLCGVPELECNKRLTVHHIDYNKKNCNGNNLISLCKGCNSKVNSNRDYWLEYFKNKNLIKNSIFCKERSKKNYATHDQLSKRANTNVH
jgi:hypothetical protein